MKKGLCTVFIILAGVFVVTACVATEEDITKRGNDTGKDTGKDTAVSDVDKDLTTLDTGEDGMRSTRGTTATADVEDKRKQTSGLAAGFVDDNKQFNRFTAFLDENKDAVNHYPIAVQERIILKVTDKNGKSLANASVNISGGGALLASGVTLADGSFLFFPSEYKSSIASYDVVVEYAGKQRKAALDRNGEREVLISFDLLRTERQNVPLDILFIFDTTASMGEEINRLKTTIEIIYSNIIYFSSKPRVRFGMVLYRDQGDDYVTQIVPLTEDLGRFQAELEKVEAEGGGDWDEDLQSALADAMTKIVWNPDGIRLAFLITDAPPHLDYRQNFTYVTACHEARQKGIKLFSIGTGELNLTGEFILRQIAQYTHAKFIFLTYGERTDTEGGKQGSVSHHVGANYQTDKLESIVMQIAREELSYLTNQPLEPEEEYFAAVKIDDEKKTETLRKLFDMAFAQLVDYSSIRVVEGTRVSIVPFVTGEQGLAASGEYFTEQAMLSVGLNKYFILVERENMQAVLKELELQLSDLVDETNAARLGKVLGAEILVTGRLYRVKENYEIFIKLVRVETAEILSVTKVKIEAALGL